MYGLLAKPSAFFPKKKFSIPYCGQICDNRFRSIPLKSGLSFPFGIGWAAFGYFMGLCRRFGQQSSPITQRSPLFAGYHEKRGKNSLCKKSNPIDFSGKISYNKATRTIKNAGRLERAPPLSSPMRNDSGIPHNSESCTGRIIIPFFSDFRKCFLSLVRKRSVISCVCYDNISGQCDGISKFRCAVFLLFLAAGA